MMNEQIAIGLLLFADSRKKNLNLQRSYYNNFIRKRGWKIIRMIEDLDIVFSIEDKKVVRIRRDGSIFYIRKFKKQDISSKKLKFMWDEVLKLINELNLNIKYENEIDISIYAKNADKVYGVSKSLIEEFGQTILCNFSLSAISDEESVLATITPTPEAVAFKVLQ